MKENPAQNSGVAAQDIQAEFSAAKPKYEKLKDEIIYILTSELSRRDIAIDLIEGRVKSLDSLTSKIERLNAEQGLSDLHVDDIVDICGIRIISLFLSDLATIGEIIEDTFDIESKDDKITAKPQVEFGYLSVHYVGILPESFSGPRYDDIKGLRFEIQVRTIAMHAWATISHYLDYKSPNSIPSDLRKDFNALSAMFYVADKHFELFFRSSQEAQQLAEQKAGGAGGIEAEEINLNTLSAYLRGTFPDRIPSDAGQISELVEQLVAAGYHTIAQVDLDVARAKNAFENFEKQSLSGNRYLEVGVVRLSLSISSEEFLIQLPTISASLGDRFRELRKDLPIG